MNSEIVGLMSDRPSIDFSRMSDGSTGLMMLRANSNEHRVRGTAMGDILDSTNGQINLVLGQGGRDRILAGKQDKLYGGKGKDTLDARNGKGRNELFGQKGRDRLFANRKDQLFGNQDNDVLNSRRGKGQNILKGGQGNDDLIAGERDRLFGGVGEDVLDASANRGGNKLRAGAGNDWLYAGVNDRLNGGDGDDILWAGRGGSKLTGGRGRDQFWIVEGALPDEVNIITDFEVGVDQVAIAGLETVDDISDLSLTQDGTKTILSIQGEAIAVFNDVTPNQFSNDDFIFAAPLSNSGTGGTKNTTITLVSRAAKFDNEMGYFFVDDVDGRIGTLHPSDAGYAEAALERSQVIFTADQEPGAEATIDIPDQQYLGWYLIQNGTTQQFQDQNPDNELTEKPLAFFSFADANPDGDAHIRYRSSTELGWEDLKNGGDRSFDDLVFKIGQTIVDPIVINQPNFGEIRGYVWEDINGNNVQDLARTTTPVSSTIEPSTDLTLGTPYENDYEVFDLGSVPGLPPSYGGLTLAPDDINTLLIGGNANKSNGAIYAVSVLRDADNHIIGFSGSATVYAEGAYNDGGILFSDDGVLFATRWPVNELGLSQPGSTKTDKIIDLDPFNVPEAAAGLSFVPDDFPGEDSLKLVTWSGGDWYDLTITPDGTGTYDLTGVTLEATLPGGPEGIAYVPQGSPGFDKPSVLVSEWSAGNVAVYEVDADGDPIVSTRQTLLSGLSGAEGAFIDPLTGDFLFSTFGSGDRIVSIQGFAPTISPEQGLAQISVYLDLNNNGALDAGEPVQLTGVDNPATPNIDETGEYHFTELLPGNYVVRTVIPPNYIQTTPNGGFYRVSLAADEVIDEINFGNQRS